jgi:hypothetical protein
MPNKIALLLTVTLVIVDVSLLLDYAYRPVQELQDGVLGEGLMDMFALGVAGLLVLFLLIFLFLYFRKKFANTKECCWVLVAFNVAFIVQMVLFGR